MKKTLIMAALAIFILSLPLTSMASRRSDIEDALDFWIDYAEDEGYEVVDTDIDMFSVDEDDIYYTITLDPGEYAVVAESGEDILDIDMEAYYEDDWEDGDDPFTSDVLDDNYPIVEFELDRTETIIIRIWVIDYARNQDDGYYCILFAGDVEESGRGGK